MPLRTKKTKWRVILVQTSLFDAKSWKTLGWVDASGEQEALAEANFKFSDSTFILGGRIEVVSINVSIHNIDALIY